MLPSPAVRPRWINDPETRRHRLPSGDLWVGSGASDPAALDALCGFAARRNPRRGFLFVSRVLGRYLPARPAPLDAVLTRLADRVPADLPGPVLFIGVAAAGVAIGHRLWARYLDRTGRDDTAFVTSTRHRFDAPLAYPFDEPHSHARRHRIHRPLDAGTRARFDQARSVVIVDDEITSGRTLAGLVAAHHRHHPHARRYVHAVLTEWTTHPPITPPGCTIELIAAAGGRYHFEPDPSFVPQMPDVTGDARPHCHAITPGHGRFGRSTPLTIDALTAAADLPRVAAGQRALVLGNGEAQYAALLLAERWAAMGVDAHYQCTVRAPVLPGGLIERVLSFDDPYGEGIPNYLYNVAPGQFDRVFICREAPCRIPDGLLQPLSAEVIDLGAMGHPAVGT